MNFDTQEAIVYIFFGLIIIFIIGTFVHILQSQAYLTCLNNSISNEWNMTINNTAQCIKPGWWFGL